MVESTRRTNPKVVIAASLAIALLLVVLLFHLTAGAVSLIRLFQIYWIGHYSKVYNALAIAICALMLINSPRRRVDGLTIIMVSMVLVGAWSGLAHNGDLLFYGAHLLAALLMLFLYAASADYDWSAQQVEDFVKHFSYAMLALYAVVLAMFWTLSLTYRPLYLGIATQILVLPLAYFALKKKWFWALLAVTLVLVSGKRSSFLVLPLAAMLVTPFVTRGKSGNKLVFAVAGSATLAVGWLAVVSLFDLSGVPLIGPVWSKWQLLNPFVPGFGLDELNRALGQRVAEVTMSFREFSASPYNWLVGWGYGWSYEGPIAYLDDPTAHYVHLSPLNYLYQYGVILAALFFGALTAMLIWIGNRVPAVETGTYAMWVALVGLLATGLGGYSYSMDPAIWLFLGIAASRSRTLGAIRNPVHPQVLERTGPPEAVGAG